MKLEDWLLIIAYFIFCVLATFIAVYTPEENNFEWANATRQNEIIWSDDVIIIKLIGEGADEFVITDVQIKGVGEE